MRHLRLERAALDVLLCAALVFAGLWRDVLRGKGTDFLLPVSPAFVVLAHVVSGGVLLLRRRRPTTSAAVLAVLSVAVPSYAALAIPYSLTRYGPRLDVGVVWSVVAVLGWSVGADLSRLADPISGPLVAGTLAVAGVYARGRAEALAELARQERRAAQAEERRRVASDLHDAVTHWVSLVIMRAGTLAVRTDDPGLRTELEGIRTDGTRAMEELAAMVTVLSDPTALDIRPRPQSFDAVISQAVSAGQQVTTRWLGPGVDDGAAGLLAAAVREALANARRHAPGTGVAIHVAVRGRSARLLVRNAAPEDDLSPALSPGAGTGLADLRQRLSSRGGTLSAGPTPEGGFEVDVSVPLATAEVVL